MKCSIFISPPSLHAGGDARAPRSHVVRSFRFLRMRAGTPALPGCTWCAHSAFAACGRGRLRSQDVRGALIPPSPHAGGDACAPSIRFNLCENCYRPARRLVRPRRWSSQIEPSRLRRWRDHADHRVTRTPTVTLSAIAHRPSAIGYQSSAIGYRLSAIGYRLSAIGYRLSATPRYSAFASASMAASADLPASSLMAVRPVAIR